MKLEQYLTEKNISQAEFARKIGENQVTVNRYVRETRTPSLAMIFAIEKETRKAVGPKDWPANIRKRPSKSEGIANALDNKGAEE